MVFLYGRDHLNFLEKDVSALSLERKGTRLQAVTDTQNKDKS